METTTNTETTSASKRSKKITPVTGPKPEAGPSELYRKYAVTIRFREWLMGGWPKSLDAELSMMEARCRQGLIPQSLVDETRAKISAGKELLTAEEAQSDAAMEGWTGFRCDSTGQLCLESRQIKAMIKECSSVMRLASEEGYKGARQVLQHAFFIKAPGRAGALADWIPLGKTEPDGFHDAICHIMTPKGPRSAIHRSDYVQGAVLEFEIWVLRKGVVDESFIRRALELAQESGLGASRSQGKGMFDIERFEAIN